MYGGHEYKGTVMEAEILITQAGLRPEDERLQLYFFLKDWYIEGSCKYFLEGQDAVATTSL